MTVVEDYKTYVISRNAYGDVIVNVFAENKPNSGDGYVYSLPHLVHHSPTGLEYGYAGSGPADLARSIVGDLLDQSEPSPVEYQRVKFNLIATLDRNSPGPFEITENQVREVLGLSRKRFGASGTSPTTDGSIGRKVGPDAPSTENRRET